MMKTTCRKLRIAGASIFRARTPVVTAVTSCISFGRMHFTSSARAQENQKNEEFILHYGRKRQTNVSLKMLMETGQGQRLDESNLSFPEKSPIFERVIIQVASFLHRELPIRLAHRALELEATNVFRQSPSIMNVCNWYKRSFYELRDTPAPLTLEREAHFAKVVESIYERHSSTLITMAKGAHEIRTALKQDVNTFAESQDIQKRLEDFYISRIGIRMLIGQYLALRNSPKNMKPDPSTVGLVQLNASPHDIAQEAIADAAYMCTRKYGDAPEVTIHGRTDLHFPYAPSHISYILLELLKNSMRATVETHGVDKMPPIRIVIADGEDNEDVVIKVSDEGGGIKRSNVPRIWSYLFTTADPAILEAMLETSDGGPVRDFDTASPLAGLGYGLPISRNYARYFGGDLVIMSMEGYGTDGFIYLPRLESSAIVQ